MWFVYARLIYFNVSACYLQSRQFFWKTQIRGYYFPVLLNTFFFQVLNNFTAVGLKRKRMQKSFVLKKKSKERQSTCTYLQYVSVYRVSWGHWFWHSSYITTVWVCVIPDEGSGWFIVGLKVLRVCTYIWNPSISSSLTDTYTYSTHRTTYSLCK